MLCDSYDVSGKLTRSPIERPESMMLTAMQESFQILFIAGKTVTGRNKVLSISLSEPLGIGVICPIPKVLHYFDACCIPREEFVGGKRQCLTVGQRS